MFGLAAILLMCGCISIPDESRIRAIRAAAADRRMADLAAKTTTARGVYLAGPLLLSEAVALALGYNRDLQQAEENCQIARGRILASYAEALPTLALTGSHTRREEEDAALAGGGRVGGAAGGEQSSAALQLTQPLFNGRIGAALRAARLYERATEAGLRSAAENTQRETIRAYYAAVLSEQLLAVHQQALETACRQLENVRIRRRQGTVLAYDELRAEVEVANSRAQMLQARSDRDQAYTTLYRLIGATPESAVELVDEIPLVKESITFADAARLALAHRADLMESEYLLRLQRENVVAARGRYLPEVSGFVQQGWTHPDPYRAGAEGVRDEWQVGVQVQLPLFDGFQRRGTLRQEEARLRQRAIALQNAEERAISEIRQAVLALQTAEEFADSQARNLELAREALRLVETGLQEGQNTPVEVLDARRALTTAAANYYQSIFAHVLARVTLQQAIGRMRPDALPDEPLFLPPAAREEDPPNPNHAEAAAATRPSAEKLEE